MKALPACNGLRERRAPARAQTGIVMFIALIALVILTIGALALMRTMTPAATVAGNIAFRQAATQASDIGTELAFDYLQTVEPHRNDLPFYHANMGNTDANGLPAFGHPAAPIDWENYDVLPCFDATDGRKLSDCTKDDSLYRVQYVIDRQCQPTPDGSPARTDVELAQYCLQAPGSQSGNSKDSRSPHFEEPRQVIYRVTVRVLGPRKTSSLVQASFAF